MQCQASHVQNRSESNTVNMRTVLLLISLFIILFVEQTLGKDSKCTRQNEIQKCVQECPPEKTCDNKDIKFNCLNTNKRCQIKCVCREGFYRNYNNECVSDEACDRCPAPNEVFACGSACQTTCATLGQPCPIINIKCNEMCYCRDGYARNENNVCIPISECKPRRSRYTHNTESGPCGPNEEYRICKQTCPPDTCFSLVARFDCSQEPPCKPGCVCKSSFLRAKPNSSCIPMRQCPELANSPDFD